jgi:hypothetical protein
MLTKLGLENLRRGDNFDDIVGIILKWISEDVNWIRVVEFKGQWHIINLKVTQKAGYPLTR